MGKIIDKVRKINSYPEVIMVYVLLSTWPCPPEMEVVKTKAKPFILRSQDNIFGTLVLRKVAKGNMLYVVASYIVHWCIYVHIYSLSRSDYYIYMYYCDVQSI